MTLNKRRLGTQRSGSGVQTEGGKSGALEARAAVVP